MILFNQIPVDIRTPGSHVEFDATKAVSGLPAAPNKILLIGLRLAAGTVAASVPTRIVAADQATQAFGRGSMLDRMARFVKAADDTTECWAVALDELAGGTAAQSTITVTGPATAAGTIALMIAGQRLAIGVASGDSAAAIAGKIVAAIAASPDLPVTSTNAVGVVTLTARHKGTGGSDIDVRVNYYQGEVLPAGVGVAFASTVAGAGNADIATAIAAIGDAQYQTIILGFQDAATLTALETELASRWGPMRQIEGIGLAGVRGPSHGALLAVGAARNSAQVCLTGTGKTPTPPWEFAAAYGARVGFAGAIDPARPFHTLDLPGVLPPSVNDRFTRNERDLLLRDGISTFTVDSGGKVLIERPITTYQTNGFGLDDVAYLDVNTPLTIAYLRHAVRTRIGLRYPRHKLADDNARFGPGQDIVTPRVLRAELIALFRELELTGLVEDLDGFIEKLIVERDATDRNRVNALIPPNIVNQFRLFAGRIEFRL